MDTLITPSEVAAQLKLSRRTVIVWLQSGKLKGVKVGSRWRVRQNDLEALLDNSQQGPGAMDSESQSWLESDLSHLGEFEPYDWEPGELEAGHPVRYVPGIGVVIDRKGHAR